MYKKNYRNWSNSKKTVVDGIKFDSKAEADYYIILQGLLQSNKITALQLQTRFTLPDMDGGKRFSYTCDFVVTKLTGEEIYLEVKGRMMPGNKLRYAYWQYVYDEKLIIIPTSGQKKFHLDWL